ncbi:dihydrofolate reductase-like domain-containing protein [Pyrenochaeta sp. MPI-SDFR-AT-0127]|nr:dihydrofolate reductase-like domain-containing protein [Pyrenochaeta sp. MPI-SDFR-AT-0127]
MRKLRYNVASTLDGFIASSDNTTHWIVEDLSIDFTSLYAQFSTFIMGRHTYETMLAFGESNPIKSKSVVVVSSTMSGDQQAGVTVIKDDIIEYIKALKTEEVEEGNDIWLMGGGSLAGLFLKERLLDSMEIAIMPVVLGKGVKMIHVPAGEEVRHSEEQTRWALKLEECEKKESGIVMTRYRVSYES